MSRYFLIITALLTVLSAATGNAEVTLRTPDSTYRINPIAADAIQKTAHRLVKACTTRVQVAQVPDNTYKAVHMTLDGTSYEFRLKANSLRSLHVGIYEDGDDGIYLLGKYADYAYQLICMIEMQVAEQSHPADADKPHR